MTNQFSSANISECGKYRYSLSRGWNKDLPVLGFLMLNPSTADATVNDPTITRCIRRAQDMGYGGVLVANLFAYRATDPSELKKVADPVGPFNDAAILGLGVGAEKIICAWGTKGEYKNRHLAPFRLLSHEKLYCLDITKDGHPKHPLYVPMAKQPVRFNP